MTCGRLIFPKGWSASVCDEIDLSRDEDVRETVKWVAGGSVFNSRQMSNKTTVLRGEWD